VDNRVVVSVGLLPDRKITWWPSRAGSTRA